MIEPQLLSKGLTHPPCGGQGQKGLIGDVLYRPSTAGGGPPPPPLEPPFPVPFQCLRLTAKILIRWQEDLRCKIFRPAFGGNHRGTLGGGGVPAKPLPPPPPLPPLYYICFPIS